MERPSPDELISAYFDGEATPEERAAVERLLADPKHRQTLEEYGQLREELRSMPAPRLSPAWSARLRDKLAEAKPAWAEVAARASSDSAPSPVAASPVATAAPFSTDGKVEAPPVVPVATLPLRGEGPSRFRQFWLAAGVGVAAGTLGIFIGWSAQTLRPESFDLDVAVGTSTTQSPAVETMARTTAPGNFAPESFAISEAEEAEKADFADAKSQDFRLQYSEPLVQSSPEAQATDSPADSAEFAGVAGTRSGAVDKSTSDEANGERLSELGQSEMKKETAPAFTGGAPPVQMGAPASGSGPWNEYADGMPVDGAPTEYFATYVGVWEANGIQLYGTTPRGVDLKRQEAGRDDRLAARDKQAEERAPMSSLSLEGTPEKVAEALEILSRAEAGGRVRLLARLDDEGLSRTRRAEGLELSVASGEELSAETESRFEDEALERRSEKLEGELSNGLADDVTVDDLAAASPPSAIDRIEAFYYRGDAGKDRQLADAIVAGADAFGAFGYREGPAPAAGGLGPGGGGVPGAGGLGGGGFGGGAFGGAEGASRTARSEMDRARSFAAPAAEAPRGNVADSSNGASGDRAPAGRRPASDAAPGAIPPPPAPAPSIAFSENAPGLPKPESAAPPANEPPARTWNVAPRQNGEAPAEGLAPAAPAIAATPARPEPASAATQGVASAPETGATRGMKSNDESAEIAGATSPMALAPSAPAEPPAADPAALEQPAPVEAAEETATLALEEQNRTTFERKLLEEVRELNLEVRSARYAQDFSGPAPQRVRVILFAPEALAREEAELAMPAAQPAGPSAPSAAPATSPAEPAADATPAEAAPAAPASAPDR